MREYGHFKVLEAIQEAGEAGLTIPELAAKFKMTRRVMQRHVARLRTQGRIEKCPGVRPKGGKGYPANVWFITGVRK